MKKKYLLLAVIIIFGIQGVKAQIWDPGQGCYVNNGECIPNTVVSALPFLTIIPESRAGGMGDAGIAVSPDANAMHFNPSKLAFAEDDLSVSATYTPWLRNIGIEDVYLAYLSGYKRVDENQTIGASLRFFSLGSIEFRDANGASNGFGKPREFELAFAYARKLGKNFSASLATKYIYSNLAGGQEVNSVSIVPGNSFAVDLGAYYFHKVKMGETDATLRYGASLTNLGSKIGYYEDDRITDFIPTNIGLGVAMDLDVNEYNSITFTLDIKKLMVPTPVKPSDTTRYNLDGNEYPDFREQALASGVLGSFTDARGGFKEELQEIYYSLGMEYWYAQQFAIRAGYYYEHKNKGNRQFFTVGLGLKYNVYAMNLSYLVPTNNIQSPLDNTLRFSIALNLGKGQSLNE